VPIPAVQYQCSACRRENFKYEKLTEGQRSATRCEYCGRLGTLVFVRDLRKNK
jgi:DNA-directed RNA polymerase subunit RPC12/RpoP